MMNLSLCSPIASEPALSLVKFLLPLDHDALALPGTLGLIDKLCYRGALAHEIVAVDDASRDATAAEARRFAHLMPVWLIQHRQPMGRSIAFRTAVEAACRDAADDDLLVPIDPRRRPETRAALNAITAARAGWDAVLAPCGRESWRSWQDQTRAPLAVYRAGLVKRHLAGFLETRPSAEAEAVQQLERYLLACGITFRRLPVTRVERPVFQPVSRIGAAPLRAGIGSGGLR